MPLLAEQFDALLSRARERDSEALAARFRANPRDGDNAIRYAQAHRRNPDAGVGLFGQSLGGAVGTNPTMFALDANTVASVLATDFYDLNEVELTPDVGQPVADRPRFGALHNAVVAELGGLRPLHVATPRVRQRERVDFAGRFPYLSIGLDRRQLHVELLHQRARLGDVGPEPLAHLHHDHALLPAHTFLGSAVREEPRDDEVEACLAAKGSGIGLRCRE